MSAPTRGGPRPGAGHPPRVTGEATKTTTINLTRPERARYDRLAARWGCGLGEAMRRATDAACEREGVG